MSIYDGLNELSREFARALFTAFPDWEPFARIVSDDTTGTDHLEVEIKQDGTDRVLHLSTVDNEITIGFDRWHTHVGPFLGLTTPESVAGAMTIIETFVTEQTVVKVSYQDGVWTGSSLQYLADPGAPEPHASTEVYSWRRTYDETLPPGSTLPAEI